MVPLGLNGTIDMASVVNNNTYYTNTGKSMTHIINGMAGNVESHPEFGPGQGITNITAFFDNVHYGFSKLTILNATALNWEFVHGVDGSVGDHLLLLKPNSNSTTTGHGQQWSQSTLQ
jgi:Iron/zinc purple acid phosphatase-like protein C